MKTLVITEKESVADLFAEALNVTPRIKNHTNNKYHYENDKYVITHFIGHLVELALPNEYIVSKHKYIQLNELPILPKPNEFKVNVSERTKGQFNFIASQLKRKDISTLVNAADAGREGELIFRSTIQRAGGFQGEIKRIWTNSLEIPAIQKGMANLKPHEDYDNLYYSASARQYADWLIGMNGSMLYRGLFATRSSVSVGRVQSPVSAAVTERDKEIAQFIPQPFYTVRLNAGEVIFESKRYQDRAEAEQVVNLTNNQEGIITKADNNKETKNPPRLFDLTELQKVANRYYGYTASHTLDLVQALYSDGLMTYPRTDSKYITDDMEESARQLLVNMPYSLSEPHPMNTQVIVNNKKVSDHTALLPTETSLTEQGKKKLSGFSESHQKIYHLVYLQFLMATGEKQIQNVQDLDLTVNQITFNKKVRTIDSLGFEKYKQQLSSQVGLKEADEDKPIVSLHLNQQFPNVPSGLHEGHTTPPKHYTEASLLHFMERAGVEDLDDDVDVERVGLGTMSTRASIIEKLIDKKYVERKKNYIISTERGRRLTQIMYPVLKDAKMTAQWENYLTQIAQGNGSFNTFMNKIYELTLHMMGTVENMKKQANISDSFLDGEAAKPIGKCPVCRSGGILEGKKAYFCENKDCDTFLFKKQAILEKSNKKLTNQRVSLLLKGEKIKIPNLISNKGTKYTGHFTLEPRRSNEKNYLNLKLSFD